jgi:uncharacterized protein (DUF488 family)
MIQLFTIGFTKKPARRFFTLLQEHQVTRLIDIRLHPTSQLAGFARRDDLQYFLKNLINCEYTYLESLTPTESILSDYRIDHDWKRYVERFEALMDERRIPDVLDQSLFEKDVCCLLCSEASPEQCHRRLVADRLAKHWSSVEIAHLV